MRLVSFVVCRGLFTTPLLMVVWKDINSSIVIKLVGTILLCQAAYYIYE